MDQRLYDAARTGDVDALDALRSADPLILNKICLSHFAETPLHVAILAGQTEFAKEIIRLMPSFARELNRDGFAPMHVASARGDKDILMELLKLDEDRSLCLQRDNNGQIPLHYAVVRGRIPVIEMLTSHCVESLQAETTLGETVLHLAVKNCQRGALEVVLKRLKGLQWLEMLWSTKDYRGKGKTVVELAEAAKQVQVLELLKDYQDASTKSPVNVETMELAADNQQHQIQIPLHSEPTDIRKENEKKESKAEGEKKPTNFELDNLLLVAAVLIATVTYQAVVTPPSTVWKEGIDLNPRCMFKISNDKSYSLRKRKRECPAEMYYLFMIANTAAFLASVLLILRVTLSYSRYFPLLMLSISILLMLINYVVLITGLSPDAVSELVVFIVPEVIVLVLFWSINILRIPLWKLTEACKDWLNKHPRIKKVILFHNCFLVDAKITW